MTEINNYSPSPNYSAATTLLLRFLFFFKFRTARIKVVFIEHLCSRDIAISQLDTTAPEVLHHVICWVWANLVVMSQHDIIRYFGKCCLHSLASQCWHKVEAYLTTETVLLLYLFTPLRNLQGHVLLPLAKLLFVYPINFVKKYRENYFAPAINQQMLFL